MKKDVIYIDIEDDITAIIDKVQNASAQIVALVPPKRVGVLQSVVNLKLLARAADNVSKRVVLITSNDSLAGLAGSVSIPVAKNLQSKPEIATVARPDDDSEDIIDGGQLPIAEFAKTSETKTNSDTKPMTKSENGTMKPEEQPAISSAPLTPQPTDNKKPKKSKSTSPKIPNFKSFRAKLFIGIAAVLLLIGFGVWAIVFAPRATIAVRATTEPVSVSRPVRIDPATETSIDEARLKGQVQQIKNSNSVDFDATGQKEIGERATGTINLQNNRFNPITLPAGTIFSANGLTFTNNQSITVPGPTLCNQGGAAAVCPGKASGGITATDIGEQYNVAPQTFSVDVDVSASTSEATSGGSKRSVKVVSQADVDRAREQLAAQNKDQTLEQLSDRFDENVIVIKESFKSETAEPTVSPEIGEETQRGRVTAETTYTVIGLPRSELEALIRSQVEQEIDSEEQQRIYDLGVKDTKFESYQALENQAIGVTIRTTAQIGPNIITDQLAERSVGKRSGEIQEELRTINGVEDVTVTLSPFWVRTAPEAEKITVEFILNDD